MMPRADRWDAFTGDELRVLLVMLIAVDADGSLPEDEARIAGRLDGEVRRALLRRGVANT